MKKRLLYTMALVLAGITSSALSYGQNTYRLDQLTGKTWQSRTPSDYYVEITYTNNGTRTYTSYIDGEKQPSSEKDFYLSDNPNEPRFDRSKVGKVLQGRYIVENGSHPMYDTEFGGRFSYFVFEILTLTDRELKTRNVQKPTIYTFDVVGAYTMKYVLDNTPTSNLSSFSISKNTGFLEGYNIPVNHAIVDKIYTNVQLTQSTNLSAQKRGKFLRKFQLGSNYIIVVTFGDLDYNRTDVICIVNSAGTVLSTLEGLVIVDGMMVKYSSIQPNGSVYVSQVVPSSSTSLLFKDVASFTGKSVTTVYNTSGSSFVKGAVYDAAQPKTFTRSILTDDDTW